MQPSASTAQARKRGPRMLVLWLVGGGVLLTGSLLSLAIAFSGESGNGDDTRADPGAARRFPLPVPEPAVAAAVKEYLASDGAIVLRFEELVDPLAELSSATEQQRLTVCTSVADQLNEEIDSNRLR